MRAGRLRERVRLLEKSTTRDVMGGQVVTWVERAVVWCWAEPVRGREYFAAEQFESEITMVFHVRYRADIQVTWRVLYRDEMYDVRSVIDPHSNKRELELMSLLVAHD